MGAACSVNVYCLGPEDQLLVRSPTDRGVINGPGVKIVGLLKKAKRRRAVLLEPTDYLKIKNELSGEVRIERGPQNCFIGAYDEIVSRERAIILGPGEYVDIKHSVTGALSQEIGPKSHFLGPYDDVVVNRRKAITLKHDEYVRLIDYVTGVIRVERGESVVYLSVTERLLEADGGKKQAVTVDAETAVLVKDDRSGVQRLVTREGLFFPGAFDNILSVRKLIKLAEYETVVVKDRHGQFHFVSGVRAANIAPGHDAGGGGGGGGDNDVEAFDEEDGAAMKMKRGGGGGTIAYPTGTVLGNAAAAAAGAGDDGDDDDDGFHIEMREAKGGNAAGGVAFFLPPYCSVVELLWSTGVHKDHKNMKKSVFDSRPWFCNYEFVCRTADNVELTLEVTFFWSLENVPAMIRNTDDAPGDMCHHARSEIVQSVSQVNLKVFMETFNRIVKTAIVDSGDTFYTDRGVRVHSVEVRSFQCRDGAIDKVLQQIIKETTDRINRLQKIESENEVRLEEMRGRIETERLKGGLIDVQNEHQRKEALMVGESEATRVRAFIDGLASTDTMDTADAITLFNLLRKVEIFSDLSKGGAHLYLTPEDANLHIGADTFPGAKDKRKRNRKAGGGGAGVEEKSYGGDGSRAARAAAGFGNGHSG